MMSREKNSSFIKLAEDIDLYELFKKIESIYRNCFFFESLGEEKNISRYHIIGFDPEFIISGVSKNLVNFDYRNGHREQLCTNDAYQYLRELIPSYSPGRIYSGGLVGFMSYDAINLFEPHLEVKSNDDFELFKFGYYADGIVFDQVTGEAFYFFKGENRYEDISFLLRKEPVSKPELKIEFLGNSMDRQQHSEAVNKVKELVADGIVFQCEVGFRSDYKVNGNPILIYERLRQINPSPHMYFVKFEDQKLIGASPELLFRLRDGEMETYPLAGTTRRGDTAVDDVRLARDLLNNEKEIAEHNMLVDLHRNDLGKVARCGTVKVRKLMDVKRYSHVQHISSEITALISEKEDMFSALAACFPAGTLTGAPKLEAIEIINSLESQGRGVYGGAVGNFAFNGDCTFAIPIRSIFINDGMGYVQTCGGIVFDSSPDNEFLEIERKLSAMKSVLEEFMEN
jgi:anthranilate synthase component I